MHTRSKFRLLVVRLGAMGDILHALPAVTALRQLHPEWVIDWVVEPRWQALLRAEDGAANASSDSREKAWRIDPTQPLDPAQPIIDSLLFAATKEWRKTPFSRTTRHEFRDLRQTLKAGRYDVVLDLQGSIRSAVLGWMTGSRRMIGEEEPREQAASWLFTEHVATRGAHMIEKGVELAAAVAGDELAPLAPWLPVSPAAEAWAEQILPVTNQPTVLINPGAGWGAKRWPVERYAEVVQALVAQGNRVLVNAGPGEEPLASAIVGTCGAAIPLSCTLAQLIALTRRVSLVIAGDTGPLHLACALGKPVVGIYGPTDPSRNGPFATQFRVLRSPESRRDHTRHAEPEAGLLTIQPDAVLQAALDLLHPEKIA